MYNSLPFLFQYSHDLRIQHLFSPSLSFPWESCCVPCSTPTTNYASPPSSSHAALLQTRVARIENPPLVYSSACPCYGRIAKDHDSHQPSPWTFSRDRAQVRGALFLRRRVALEVQYAVVSTHLGRGCCPFSWCCNWMCWRMMRSVVWRLGERAVERPEGFATQCWHERASWMQDARHWKLTLFVVIVRYSVDGFVHQDSRSRNIYCSTIGSRSPYYLGRQP